VGIQVAGSPDVWKNGRKRTQRAETARRESEDVQMCGTDPVTVGSKRAAALFSQPSVKKGIRALFNAVLDDLDNPANPRMCFMANSVSCDVVKESELRQLLEAALSDFQSRFVARLQRAVQSGELPKDFDPVSVAAIVGTFMQGLLRGVIINYDRRKIERQVEIFLTGLGF
jgi:TetR/AcrR family transcriptional regulator, transcriptional repressor for nem operon